LPGRHRLGRPQEAFPSQGLIGDSPLSVTKQPVPGESLLRTYRDDPEPGRWDRYSDCYGVTIDRAVTLAEFVYAFYTSPVFRLERLILRFAVDRPSSDDEARQIADGTGNEFAAWRVGARTGTQLLMCDVLGRTRSWFSVTSITSGAHARTLLQFGSGVAASVDRHAGQPRMSAGFRVMLGFHDLYSRVLLAAAKARLGRRDQAVTTIE
jgi:hypothetical protein